MNGVFSVARTDSRNRTGQPDVDLLSGNINWRQVLVSLKGRAGLDLELALVYNSLVWTRAGSRITFDADRGQPSHGFRLGLPTIQPRYFNSQTSKHAYLLITPRGEHVELRQVAKTDVYEATDNSLQQMIDRGASGALLRRPDGTQLTFEWLGGQLQCTEIKDRNGNYITASYNARGHISRVTDTLGRTLTFNRDSGGNLLSITQSRSGQEHALATFGYSELAIRLNSDSEREIQGLRREPTVKVLTQVGLPDGTRYQFDYTVWGQIRQFTHRAADDHILSYTAYDLPQNSGAALADGLRPSERRDWVENWNNGVEAVLWVASRERCWRGAAP